MKKPAYKPREAAPPAKAAAKSTAAMGKLMFAAPVAKVKASDQKRGK